MSEHEDASTASSARGPLGPPAAIPDHELVRLIGEGSYGEVWLARNTLGTYRAIKIVYEKKFRHKKPFEREFNGVQKFEPVSRLHDGLMDVLQVGRNDAAGYFYCVMELADDVVSGPAIHPERYQPRTLAHDIAKLKRLPIAECRRLGADIASALEFLHGRGLIHRDVKPSNIVFVNGVPKLADIGLVAEMSEARSYVGTEGFIPPEGPGTVQADVYSLGKVLYEISTGKDRHDFPELPTRLGDAEEENELFELNKIILKACRNDPRQRYKAAEAMVKELAALENGRRAIPRGFRKRFSGRAAGVSAGLTIVAAIVWWAVHRKTTAADTSGFPPGLVSWWRGENSTADATGRNDGKIAGTGRVTYGPGVVGQAFVFDGIHRDRVEIGNPVSLQLQDFTIEAWIKRSSPTNISLDDLGEDGSSAGKGALLFSYGRTGYGFGLKDGGCLMLTSVGVGGVESSNLVNDTLWHHVAVTKSGLNVVFYRDGAAASETLSYDGTFFFDSPAAIGSIGDGIGGTFFGMIDELAIYNRALTVAEIQARHNTGTSSAHRELLRSLARKEAGLAGWWPGDDDADDQAGGHNGVLVNAAGFAPGRIRDAFRLNGKNQFVKIPRAPELDVGGQLTIAFWMKADPDNTMRTVQGLVTTDFYGVEISSGYQSNRLGVNFYLSTDGGRSPPPQSFPDTADANSGGAVVTAGQWHHIAGTYDGAQMHLYVDGLPWGKPMAHSGVVSPMPANSFLTIGSEDGKVLPGCKGRYFKGLIDDVCIYRRALSAHEVEQRYRAGNAGESFAQSRDVR